MENKQKIHLTLSIIMLGLFVSSLILLVFGKSYLNTFQDYWLILTFMGIGLSMIFYFIIVDGIELLKQRKEKGEPKIDE